MRGKTWTESTGRSEAEIVQYHPEDMSAIVQEEMIVDIAQEENMSLLEMTGTESTIDTSN